MNNDLIDRGALRKAIEEQRKPKLYSEADERQNVIIDCILYIIDNAPKVNPYFPISEEVFYKITDAELEFHDSFWVSTPSGKKVEFEKKRPQGDWILVSERLPKEEDYRPCYCLPDGCVMWQTDNGDIGFGWYYNSTKCWSDIYDHPIKTGEVIAWQPLPEPYKKGGAKNENCY